MGAAVWSPGIVDGALVFDGVDDTVTTGLDFSDFITATAGTFACWMKPTGSASSQTNAFDLPAVVGDFFGYAGIARGIAGGLDRIWAYNFDTNEDRVGVTYDLDQWVHIAWRRDSTNIYIYKNGVEAGTIASGATTLTGDFVLGKNAGPTFYSGYVDDCRLFNTALTAAEIRAIFDEVRHVPIFPPRPFMRIR